MTKLQNAPKFCSYISRKVFVGGIPESMVLSFKVEYDLTNHLALVFTKIKILDIVQEFQPFKMSAFSMRCSSIYSGRQIVMHSSQMCSYLLYTLAACFKMRYCQPNCCCTASHCTSSSSVSCFKSCILLHKAC
jgi:hypothetical protein